MSVWKNITIQVSSASQYGPQIVDKLIARLRTKYGDTRYAAIVRMFFKGVEAIIKELGEEDEDVFELEELLKDHHFAIALEDEASRMKSLEKSYRTLGAEGFMRIGLEKGKSLKDIEWVIERYKIPGADSWYEKTKRWMVSLVQTLGEVDTDDIKRRAIERGILTDSLVDKVEHDRQWRSMKTCASELGLSSKSHRGYWKVVAGDLDGLVIQ